MRPKYSIIIPVYNVAPYLRACVDSVIAAAEKFETFEKCRVEVVCVDDGSTDGASEILDSYLQLKTLTFKVIHQPNQGVSAARNRALEEATGEWIWFVDGDDLIHQDSLSIFAAAIKKYPQAGIIEYSQCSGSVIPNEWGRSSLEESVLVGEARLLESFVGASKFLMRRDLIGSQRFKPFRWLEDILFVAEYLEKCDTMAKISDVLYFYRMREGSAVHASPTRDKVEEVFAAMNALYDVAERIIQKERLAGLLVYKKRLHQLAYFTFLGWYFALLASDRKLLLSDWLSLQHRAMSCYRAPLEWRLRIACVRFLDSGLMVKPLVLWGRGLRGMVARLISGVKGL